MKKNHRRITRAALQSRESIVHELLQLIENKDLGASVDYFNALSEQETEELFADVHRMERRAKNILEQVLPTVEEDGFDEKLETWERSYEDFDWTLLADTISERFARLAPNVLRDVEVENRLFGSWFIGILLILVFVRTYSSEIIEAIEFGSKGRWAGIKKWILLRALMEVPPRLIPG